MDTQVIILAGGLGKRMGANAPKALTLLKGKPLIQYALDSIKNSGICPCPAIVVGKMADKVISALGPGYQYIFQNEQLGTGHAVRVAKPYLEGKSRNVLVLYGDHPFVAEDAILRLIKTHEKNRATLSMMTVTVPDFHGWREAFYGFGRVLRNAEGKPIAIVETKDAREDEKDIKEVSPSFFCYDAHWLWENIENITNDNMQKEYYLSDLLGLAIHQGKIVVSIPVDPKVAFGVNTPEELAWAEKLL